MSLVDGHYRDVLARLSRRGVRISIYYRKQKWLDVDEFRTALEEAGVTATLGALPASAHDSVEGLGLHLRELGNVLRYAHPDYEGMTNLTERSFEKKSPGVQRWARRFMWMGRRPAHIAARIAGALQREVPASRAATKFIRETAPTAVAAAPVHYVPVLVDYLKAAAEQGISTATWVQSWDNLTNKGLLHFTPDRVFVWNQSQAAELARYHGIAADHVMTTGAQTFDHWFTGAPLLDRQTFCSEMGLDPGKPIILYLASSKQIAPDEPVFFRAWLDAVRSSDDEVLRSASVLVRPHPTMLEPWLAANFESEPGIALSPATHRDRLNSDEFREQYRNELHHCTVAFGVNTSGAIDAAIFGKPVCTVEAPELFQGQRGTVHFHHLVREDGPLLRASTTLHEHVDVLSSLIRREPYARDPQSEAFVADFIRPHGPDVIPAEVFANEMEALCHRWSSVEPRGRLRRARRRLIARCALILGAPLETDPFQHVFVHVLASIVVRTAKLRRRIAASIRKMIGVRVAVGTYKGARRLLVLAASTPADLPSNGTAPVPALVQNGHPENGHVTPDEPKREPRDGKAVTHLKSELEKVTEALAVLEARLDLVDGRQRGYSKLRRAFDKLDEQEPDAEQPEEKKKKRLSPEKKDRRAIKKELWRLERRRNG